MMRKAYSATELSLKTGISTNSISKIKNGKRKCRPATVGRIAAALGVDVTEIIEME